MRIPRRLRPLWRRAIHLWLWARRLPTYRRSTVEVDGFLLHLDLRDNVQREIAERGTYEPDIQQLLLGEITDGDVVLDVGAHVGIHALACGRRLRKSGRVIAFEATPATADRLRRAAEQAGLSNITVETAALSDTAGVVSLRSDPWFGPRDSAVYSMYGPGGAVVSVAAVRFDDWAAGRSLDRLDIVKMDVEGAEHAALTGMADALRRLRPRLLIIEEQPYLLERAGVPQAAIGDFLSSLGYDVTGRIDRDVVYRHRSS